MKVSYDILKRFVTPPQAMTAKELAETLTMHTVEVEGYEDMGARLAGVMVGLVKELSAHPNADKLKLATIDVGKETCEVVCGGVNLKQGMKVAFAKVGAKVRWHGQGDWMTLEKAKIRGVESNGMACAAEELGLPDPKAVEHGIMDLSHLKAKPGTALAEALGLTDVVLDIDNKSITHRPDLWGHLGLARELAAVWQLPFTPPEPPQVQVKNHAKLSVTIKAPEQCYRYLGVIMGNVKVGESPPWLKDKLLALGMRPINNVVDVTNYVMLELGQPLHAFDLSKLASADIIVRLAKTGEKLVTLDGVERKLDSNTLVIADKKQPQALAGIMGGRASEVSPDTTHLVLEGANFDCVSTRKTASRLSLRSEASIRFEKALDPNLAELAMRRAVELFQEIMPGCEALSPVADEYPKSLGIQPIELNLPWLRRRLGLNVSLLKVQTILGSLGFKLNGKGDTLVVTPPAWRATRDVTLAEDLLEEVARIYGYDKIPLTLPKFDITPPQHDEAQDLRWRLRDFLVGAGWVETLTYSFVANEVLPYFGFTKDGQRISTELCLELENPVDKNQKYLRPSLLPNLLAQAGRNSHDYDMVQLFELGRVFVAEPGVWPAGDKSAVLPKQPYHLGLVLGQRGADRLETFRRVKGVLMQAGSQLGLDFAVKRAGAVRHDWCEHGTMADIFAGKVLIGHMAVVHQKLCEELDLPGATVAVELTLEPLTVKQFNRPMRPLPRYPAVRRDFSIVVSTQHDWAELQHAVQNISPLVEAVEVFDVYPEKGSLAFHVTFRSAERTLKVEEADEVVLKITKLLERQFGAKVRS